MAVRGALPAEAMDQTRHPHRLGAARGLRGRAARPRALPGVRPHAADPGARLGARSAAASRLAPRGARALAARPAPRRCGCPRCGRRSVVVHERRAGRVHAESRGRARLGPRTASTPGRRALPRPRRAGRRRARVRFRGRARRGASSARGAPLGDRAPVGDEPGVDGLAEALALAGYERSTGSTNADSSPCAAGSWTCSRRRVASPCASSSSRRDRAGAGLLAVHAARAAHGRPDGGLPGRRASCRHRRAGPRADEGDCGRRRAGRSRAARAALRRPRLAAGRGPQAADEGDVALPSLAGATELDPFPRSQPARLRGAATRCRGARARRGGERARGLRSRRKRVVVSFAHRGEAERQAALLRKVDAPLRTRANRSPPGPASGFAVAPARRGFVWRELGLVLLPDTQVFRKRPPRATDRLGRALQSFADLRVGDYVVHEDHGIGQAARLRDEGGRERHARLPASRLPRRGPALRPARAARKALAVHRRGCDGSGPLEARRQGLAEPQGARARPSGSSPASCSQLYAQRQRAGRRVRPPSDWLERLEASFPVPRDGRPAARDRGGQGGSRGAAPMDRLVCGDVGFGKTEVAVRAAFAVAVNGRRCSSSARRRFSRAALEHVPRPLPRLPVRSRWSRASAGRRGQGRARGLREGKVESSSGTHRSSRAT
jgi:hypothetical protein